MSKGVDRLRDMLSDDVVDEFLRLIGIDIGVACDKLMRHFRGEYWPRRIGQMPPLRKPTRGEVVKLPKPKLPTVSVGEAILSRRSADDFKLSSISLEDLATVLYLSVGITGYTEAYGYSKYPLRAYPSAGALQPIEAYPVVNLVDGLRPGLYRYDAFTHSLEVIKLGNFSGLMADIALGQDHVSRASAVLIMTAYYARTRWKYWKRALRYVLLDAGAAMENAYIAATGLGLGVRAVGAFYDEELCNFLSIDCASEIPVVLILLGHALRQ